MRRRKASAAPHRVVLDTNVALSALVFSRGRLAWVREAWHEQRLTPLVSRPTAEELLAVLSYPKFKLTPEDQQELLADYLPWCETVALPEALPTLPACRDPDDQKFPVLAAIAKADALITGDADLLDLQASFPIPILDPESFRQRLLRP